MDAVSYALALEEISRACASTGVIMSVQNSLVCDPILHFGTDAQRQRWLPGLAVGQEARLLRAVRARRRLRRRRRSKTTRDAATATGWVLNGTKNFITNGPVADVVVVFAMTDAGKGTRGISAFIVADRHARR